MARLARVVVPGVARHVAQRGNRRQPTFLQEEYEAYLALLGEWCWRPLGETTFLDQIEDLLGREIRPAKRGRKPKRQEK